MSTKHTSIPSPSGPICVTISLTNSRMSTYVAGAVHTCSGKMVQIWHSLGSSSLAHLCTTSSATLKREVFGKELTGELTAVPDAQAYSYFTRLGLFSSWAIHFH
eukprot:scaffold1173_cov405-Prasinococcus_capsulatus_cf.AAC.10